VVQPVQEVPIRLFAIDLAFHSRVVKSLSSCIFLASRNSRFDRLFRLASPSAIRAAILGCSSFRQVSQDSEEYGG
jgi:hypothetical protein